MKSITAIEGGKEKFRLNEANIFVNKFGKNLTDFLLQRYMEGKSVYWSKSKERNSNAHGGTAVLSWKW